MRAGEPAGFQLTMKERCIVGEAISKRRVRVHGVSVGKPRATSLPVGGRVVGKGRARRRGKRG